MPVAAGRVEDERIATDRVVAPRALIDLHGLPSDRHVGSASGTGHGVDAELEAASRIRLNLEDDPALVPLELLPGRNHTVFPRAEEPPWRWRVESR